MTIQCSMLCPRRIQSVMQPCANDYVIMQSKSKVCELYSLCDWIVQQILKCQFFVTLWQQGISLAYEWRLLLRYISKQSLHCCLASDHEAKSDRAACIIVHTITPTFRKCRMCFSPFKPYQLLFLISMLWKCIRGKCSCCSWLENWRMHLSQKWKLSLRRFASAANF